MKTQQTTEKMVLSILLLVSFAHLLNDLIQAVLVAIYPLLKQNYQLTFTQIGMISLVYQVTASLIQPWIGLYTDKHPKPYLLPFGMVITLIGVLMLAFSPNFIFLLMSAMVIGLGSAIFHPEASRVARLASAGRFGTAQSTFQVGGNTGSAIGPLLVALLIVPNGQLAILSLVAIAILGIGVLYKISRWIITQSPKMAVKSKNQQSQALTGKKLQQALLIIGILLIAKFTYMVSISNYLTFYLIQKFGLSTAQAQYHLFAFLFAVAFGTFVGGPIGDKIGRNRVIWFSFLGMAPFALFMPYVNLFWLTIFSILSGLILSSAFSAMVVYAQEAMPNRVGMVSGLMFGVMFGISGISASILGFFAETHGIETIFTWCAFMPLLGIFALFLPKN